MINRRNIKRINTPAVSTGDDPSKHYPRVTIRGNGSAEHHPAGIQTRKFNKRPPPPPQPVVFMEDHHLPKPSKDICFVVGGGPSLSGFDFSQLNGYDTIAINKSVEFIQNPTYFITTDYTYFEKGNLPIEGIRQKCNYTYFVANMSHPYMTIENGLISDTRGIHYNNLYKCNGVIESNTSEGLGDVMAKFSSGNNSGHCGIQLALLLGYKKIYLLGFDLKETAHTHFHQSYSQSHQLSFKRAVSLYGQTLLSSLAQYSGPQKIINLSADGLLATSPHIKTQSFQDVLIENGEHPSNKAITPNTFDDLMIVGYYTVNTPYEEEAQNLINSLTKLGMSKDIVGVNNLGNWQANTRFKAGFMLDMLLKYPNHRLVYIDCDAVMHKVPILFKNYDCDIAVRWQDFRWRENECLSGTIYMANNHKTQRLCRLWRDVNANEGNDTDRMEQWNLDTVIQQMKTEDPSFKVNNLPPEYTFIFDSMKTLYPHAVPIIEHFQASRRFKHEVNKNK